MSLAHRTYIYKEAIRLSKLLPKGSKTMQKVRDTYARGLRETRKRVGPNTARYYAMHSEALPLSAITGMPTSVLLPTGVIGASAPMLWNRAARKTGRGMLREYGDLSKKITGHGKPKPAKVPQPVMPPPPLEPPSV